MDIRDPTSIDPAEELDAIAARLRSALTRTAEDVLSIGRDLRTAKRQLGHGRFGPWIEQELGLSPRWARQFMLAAERFGPRPEAASRLPGGVLLELASPSVSDALVTDVIAGRIPPKVAAVRDAIRNDRRAASGRRAARSFVEELWDLPDGVSAAARSIADEVLDVLEEDPAFPVWVAETLRTTAELIEERYAEDGS